MTPQSYSNLPQDKLLLAMLGGAALGVIFVAVASQATRKEVSATMRALKNRLLGRKGNAEAQDGEEILAVFI
jgi:hypothetical protein